MRNRPARPLILQLITTLDPGGAEHQLLALVRYLRPRFRFSVAYFKGPGGLTTRFQELGVPTYDLRIRDRLDATCLVRLRRLIADLQPDLVVTHLFKADLYGSLAAAGARIPVVSHKHNEDQFLLHPFYGALARATVSPDGRQIAVSDAVRRFYIRRAAFPPGRFCTILHGIDAELPARGILARVPAGRSPDGPCIGTVARLTSQKGLPTLIQATALLCRRRPRLRCVIAGRGEEGASLQALCQELGVAEHVRFAGHVADVNAFLRTLDVFVLPSRWEGFGIVLLEAMAQARAVVATCVGGIPEVIKNGRTGLLVPPDNPEALALAVESLLDNARLRLALGLSARDACTSQFSARRMADETAAVYEDVIRERSVEGPGDPA